MREKRVCRLGVERRWRVQHPRSRFFLALSCTIAPFAFDSWYKRLWIALFSQSDRGHGVKGWWLSEGQWNAEVEWASADQGGGGPQQGRRWWGEFSSFYEENKKLKRKESQFDSRNHIFLFVQTFLGHCWTNYS